MTKHELATLTERRFKLRTVYTSSDESWRMNDVWISVFRAHLSECVMDRVREMNESRGEEDA